MSSQRVGFVGVGNMGGHPPARIGLRLEGA
jgi:hypothetical protein